MSYILDALKKSEQERQQRVESASLQSHRAADILHDHESEAVSENTPKNIPNWLWTLASIGISLLALVLVLMNSNTDTALPIMEQLSEEAQQPESVLNTQPQRIVSDSQPTEHKLSLASPPVTVDLAESEPVLKAGAPYEVLQRIPDLIVTGHLFSSIPEKRSITINGHTWREGQIIANDVRLHEITKSGAILDVQGWAVEMERSQGWKAL